MNYGGGMECGREGVGRMEWSEGGGKWDNCNSIINKYIFKKTHSHTYPKKASVVATCPSLKHSLVPEEQSCVSTTHVVGRQGTRLDRLTS